MVVRDNKKLLTLSKILAYYARKLIRAVKSFMILAARKLIRAVKSFMILALGPGGAITHRPKSYRQYDSLTRTTNRQLQM